MAKTHLRWMIRRDLTDVMGIEHLCYAAPWSADDLITCLRQRNCIGMVAEQDDELIVGFMIYELHATKIVLVNIAVAPAFWRQGIGSAMVTRLFEKLRGHRRDRIAVTVNERNLTAQLFFRRHKFRCVKTIKGFYQETGEDGYLMEYDCDRVTGLANRVSLYGAIQ